MPRSGPQSKDLVEDAVVRLWRTKLDFTRAYEAWAESPEFAHLGALDHAEKRMTAAEREAAIAQRARRKDSP